MNTTGGFQFFDRDEQSQKDLNTKNWALRKGSGRVVDYLYFVPSDGYRFFIVATASKFKNRIYGLIFDTRTDKLCSDTVAFNDELGCAVVLCGCRKCGRVLVRKNKDEAMQAFEVQQWHRTTNKTWFHPECVQGKVLCEQDDDERADEGFIIL